MYLKVGYSELYQSSASLTSQYKSGQGRGAAVQSKATHQSPFRTTAHFSHNTLEGAEGLGIAIRRLTTQWQSCGLCLGMSGGHNS